MKPPLRRNRLMKVIAEANGAELCVSFLKEKTGISEKHIRNIVRELAKEGAINTGKRRRLGYWHLVINPTDVMSDGVLITLPERLAVPVEVIHKIDELVDAGFNNVEIGDALGISAFTISGVRNRTRAYAAYPKLISVAA